MDIKVIAETRDLLIPCTTLGTTLEDNATELHFIISEKLNELKEKNVDFFECVYYNTCVGLSTSV